MKRLALYVAVFLATLGGIYLLWQLRLILLLLLLAMFVAATIRPFVHRLHQIGLPLMAARLLAYGGGLAGFLLLSYAISAPLLSEVDVFTNWLIISYERAYQAWTEGTPAQQLLQQRLPAPNQLAPLLSQQLLLVRLFFGVTQGILIGIGGAVLVFALSFYWDMDQNRIERLWLSLLPMPQRTLVRQFWRKLETAVSRYIRLELLQSLGIGFLLWLSFASLRLDYSILLALLGALAWFIPRVGVVFIAIPVYWIGSLKGTATAVGATLVTVLIMGLMEYGVEPRFLKHRRYSPLLILLVTIPLVDLLGLIGIVLAAPLAVTIQILLGQLFLAYARKSKTIPVTDLEERHHQLVSTLSADNPDFHKTEAASILKRLQRLIKEAGTINLQES